MFGSRVKGMIAPDAKPGFLNIPGAPDVNLVWAFLWSIWVGWIFSTVYAYRIRRYLQ